MRATEIPEGFELVSVPLHGVAYRQDTGISKTFQDGRVIEFYEAEPEQFVKAYDNGAVVWAAVSGFSIHRNIRIVLINLTNGCQIVSDHDPRAVFGVEPGSIDPGRFYPDEALEKGVLVPCDVPQDMQTWGAETLMEPYEDLWEALNRKAWLLANKRLGSRVLRCPYDREWKLYAHDLDTTGCGTPHASLTGTQWAGIESVCHTYQLATGYDLTVPGYETFMSVDGIILSNTMTMHVPATKASVDEAIEKLMPSKMPFSIKSHDKLMPTLKHEEVLGLYDAQHAPAAKTWKFDNKEDAMAAIHSGTVSLSDEVEFPGMPKTP